MPAAGICPMYGGMSGLISPLSISGSIVHLNADIGTTIATGVSQWDDQSGNGNHVSQGTGANQPTLVSNWRNGKKAVQGNGTSQSLSRATFTGGALAMPRTLFVVYDSPLLTNAEYIVASGNGANRCEIYIPGTGTVNAFDGANIVTGSAPHPTHNAFCVAFAEYNGPTSATLSVYHSGGLSFTTIASASTTTMQGITVGAYVLGASNWCSKPIGNVTLYDKILSSGEKIALKQWANSYYAQSV